MDKDRTHCSRNTPCIHPLQCPAAYSNTHTHTRTLTHTQGVLSLMAVRSESDKLTSPANTVHWECGSLCVCVCAWVRQRAAARNSRCSPAHHKHDLQSHNLSLYSHNEVSADQKQIWDRTTLHSHSFLPLYIHHERSKLNSSSLQLI